MIEALYDPSVIPFTMGVAAACVFYVLGATRKLQSEIAALEAARVHAEIALDAAERVLSNDATPARARRMLLVLLSMASDREKAISLLEGSPALENQDDGRQQRNREMMAEVARLDPELSEDIQAAIVGLILLVAQISGDQKRIVAVQAESRISPLHLMSKLSALLPSDLVRDLPGRAAV